MKQPYILLIALTLALSACAGKKTSVGGDNGQGPNSPIPIAPPPDNGAPTPTPPNYPNGATMDLTLDPSNSNVFRDYTGRVGNNPEQFKVNINFNDRDVSGMGKRFGGVIKISYRESNGSGGYSYSQGTFDSGSGDQDIRYNREISYSNKNFFKGFVQDIMGSLIIVVDKAPKNEFGQMEGRIYFRNFTYNCEWHPWYGYVCQNPVQGPMSKCWNIEAGPYDCRGFMRVVSGDDYVDLTVRDYPTSGSPDYYQLLGTFLISPGEYNTALGL